MTMTVEGLDEDWMYEFRIKCANLIGESEPSIPLLVVIQDDEGMAECRRKGLINPVRNFLNPKDQGSLSLENSIKE